MALPDNIATALTALANSVTALRGLVSAQPSTKATAMSGKFSLASGTGVITLGAVADPKDFVRLSGTYTVDETIRADASAQVSQYSTSISNKDVVRRRVFVFDEVSAVGVDGVTCKLRPIPAGTTVPDLASHTVSVDTSTGAVAGFLAMKAPPAPTYALVSSSLTLVTRYHYS